MNQKPGGVALAFTEIKVADWPGAVRWYVEVLGLRPVLEDPARQFVLLGAQEGEPAGRLALKGGGERGAGSNVRLIFQVEDVDAERERLTALGTVVEPATDDPVEHFRSVRLVDPEGTPITLFAWRAAGETI